MRVRDRSYGCARAVRWPLQNRVETAAVLVQRGLIRPMRPDRFLRQSVEAWRWGATIAAAYAAHAAGSPDQLALSDDEGTLTYPEIHARTNALARGLLSLGTREGDSVAILSRNGRGFVEPLVACSKLGADVLLLNTSFSPADVRAVIERERPSVLVYDDEFSNLIGQASLGAGVVRLIAHHEGDKPSARTVAELIDECDRSGLSPPEHESRPVILTSGTTGTPKGARIARADSVDPLAWLLRVVPLKARSAYLIPAPLFHAHGFGQMLVGGALACNLVLSRKFDAERTLALIDEHRAHGLVTVPVMLKRIMDLPPNTRRRYDTSSLRVVLSSGSALPPELAQAFMDDFGPVLYNLYGSTEVAGATIATPKDLLEAPGTVGRPLPHARIAILGDDGRVLSQGEVGRIFVGHEMLFEGYTDDSRLDESSEGMISPGDLGRLDESGRLFVVARSDDMIISGGENVYPSEVEAVLARHPEVEEAVAVGVDDEQFGQRFVAFVVLSGGSSLSSEELLAFAKENLARYKVPREIRVVEELPRNALGKVLRKDLRAKV
jgi:acyl-CoA synthetase (AMP-forming)/AMP-acid ligase II